MTERSTSITRGDAWGCWSTYLSVGKPEARRERRLGRIPGHPPKDSFERDAACNKPRFRRPHWMPLALLIIAARCLLL